MGLPLSTCCSNEHFLLHPYQSLAYFIYPVFKSYFTDFSNILVQYWLTFFEFQEKMEMEIANMTQGSYNSTMLTDLQNQLVIPLLIPLKYSYWQYSNSLHRMNCVLKLRKILPTLMGKLIQDLLKHYKILRLFHLIFWIWGKMLLASMKMLVQT